MGFEWVISHKWALLFYGIIILLLYIYRRRFDRQGRFILLYRTKLGLRLMDKISQRHARFIRGISYVGIVLGYLGMIVIVGFIIYGLYQLFFVPDAPAPIQPVIPGVAIPGSAIKVPLIIGWIALFISAAVHEFSHGVVARAYGIKVKSSGFAFIGPLAAAFVEPDEKQMQKESMRAQNSVFAAGPFANMILGLLMAVLLLFAWSPIVDGYLQPDGFVFSDVTRGFPADKAGITPATVYTYVDDIEVNSQKEFYAAIAEVKPNQTVIISNKDSEHAVLLAEHPSDASRGYFGVINTKTSYTNENTALSKSLFWIGDLLNWIFIISLGLGLANLLPIGPVDGGRLFQTAAFRFLGPKKGKKVWGYVTLAFLGLLIILFYPIFKAIFESILSIFIPGI